MWSPQKQGSDWKFLVPKPSFYRFWAAHALLILANPIVTFVKPTNQNAGFMINVQFLDKVGRACQQDQRDQINYPLMWSAACAEHGMCLVENFKSANYDVTPLTYAETIKQKKNTMN